MSAKVKGPAIFLAQFAGDAAPFNSFDAICKWAASLGYKGVQIPTWDGRLFDLTKAAASKTYCDEIDGHRRRATASRSPNFRPICRASSSRSIRPMTRRSTPSRRPKCTASPRERQKWAVEQVMMAAQGLAASRPEGHASRFSGALAWPFVYPWPQRAPGLIETAFEELAQRWKPILNALTRPASTSAMKSIPARTCSTARPSSGSSTR